MKSKYFIRIGCDLSTQIPQTNRSHRVPSSESFADFWREDARVRQACFVVYV